MTSEYPHCTQRPRVRSVAAAYCGALAAATRSGTRPAVRGSDCSLPNGGFVPLSAELRRTRADGSAVLAARRFDCTVD
eukprot:IDg4034t1